MMLNAPTSINSQYQLCGDTNYTFYVYPSFCPPINTVVMANSCQSSIQ